MPRTPKSPGTRARRNSDQHDWQEVQGKTSVPRWPGDKDEDPREALTYWRAVWTDLGGMYAAPDKMPLYRASLLHAAVIASTRRKGLAKALSRIARTLEDEADQEFLADLSREFSVGGGDAAAAKELRELEDRLGISPQSRRRLQWELAKGTGKTDPATAAPNADQARARRTATGTVLSALT